MKIRTECTGFDWLAYDDNTYDGAPDSRTRNQIGSGATERDAINDLLEQFGVEPVLYWFNVETEQLRKGAQK